MSVACWQGTGKAEEQEAKKQKDEEEHKAKKQQLLPSLTALMLPYESGTEQDFKKLLNKQLLSTS